MAEPIITAQIWLNGEERIVEIRGRDAVALVCLNHAGARGCSDFNVPPSAHPLPERVTALRERFDLDIQDLRVMRRGDTVPEYALITDVEILHVSDELLWTG